MNELPENLDALSDVEIETIAQQLLNDAAAKREHQRSLLAFLNDRRRGLTSNQSRNPA